MNFKMFHILFSNQKKKFKYNINQLKFLFSLHILNSFEANGRLGNFTKFKFLPKTYLQAPFSLGRTIRGLSFDKHLYSDPFAIFLKKIIENENDNNLINYLLSCYDREHNLNASDLIRLPNKILSKYPGWALVLPWDQSAIDIKFKNYPIQFIKNRLKFYKEIENTNEKNYQKLFYSIENAKSQLIQTKELYKSIKKNGLRKSKEMPKIHILINGNEWRWLMSGQGNHRAYILNELKYQYLECEVDSIISKNDLTNLNNVKNNIFSEYEAEKIFDHFFKGDKCFRGMT